MPITLEGRWFMNSQTLCQVQKKILAAGGTFEVIIEALTMAIQIWRLWIIWSGTRYATVISILPVLLLLSYIALAISMNIVVPLFTQDQQIHQLGISESIAIAMTTASYAVPTAITILVTGLIATRLLLARRQHAKIMRMSESASPYLSVVAMLVESYILDAAWSLASAISYGVGNPSGFMFVTNDPFIKIIAYFLVVYRVATGRGWTRQTDKKLTSLQWNHGAPTTTHEISNVQSRVRATTTTVVINSPPIDHPDSTV